MVKRFLLYIVLLLLPASAAAQEVMAFAATDSTDYLVGDLIHLTIQVTHGPDDEILMPMISDSLLVPLEIISADSAISSTEGQLRASSYVVTLAGYDSMDVTIPPVTVPYRSRQDSSLKFVDTDSLMVTVHTVPVDMTADFRDIREPQRIPFDWLSLWPWVVGALLLALLLWYLWKLRKKKQTSEPVIVKRERPPFEIAYDELRELNEQRLWQRGLIKEYHSEITGIIRKYFAAQYKLPAMEMPSSETLERLRGIPEAQDVYEVSEEFLSNADMVKFAKFMPLASVNQAMMRQATKIVDLTKARPLAPPVTEPEEAETAEAEEHTADAASAEKAETVKKDGDAKETVKKADTKEEQPKKTSDTPKGERDADS